MAKTTKTARKASKAKASKAKAPKSEGILPRVLKGTIVPLRYKAAYAEHNDTCGDRVALALKEATQKVVADTSEDGQGGTRTVLDVDALWAIAKANGVDYSKYKDMNNGQKRMNVGNKLRGMVRDGLSVKIAGKTYEGAAAIKAKAKVEAPTPAEA